MITTKDGRFETSDLAHLGLLLVKLRVAAGLTQTELAKRLGVDRSNVSRDESDGYCGITLERATRVLYALNVQAHINLKLGRSPADSTTEAPDR